MENTAKSNNKLFTACFVALMATSFGFMLRAMLITDWSHEFNLTKTQMGEIIGVGLWPFAISIVLFSLVIDRIGYGKAMIFAFICHVASVIVTILANGYWMLYIGTFIFALGNGAVEATINPIIATIYKDEKTKWLNRLHAGWPGGMVVGGILAMGMGADMSWRIKLGIILIPILIYGVLLINKKFPVHERVQAGVSYKDMLKEVGIIGALIIISLMVFQVGNFFGFSLITNLIIIAVLTTIYGIYTKSLGQPLFIILLLIMIPLATTELGTDSWIVNLMEREMNNMGLQAGWILVYTAIIMTIFRFYAGPLVKTFTPIGLLMLGSAVAVIGLFFLSTATGIAVFIAATIYGFGKSYFWPTMIGIVGERFPKGGALTLNMVTGVGMIAVGIVGAVFLGFVQDKEVDKKILAYDQGTHSAIHENYMVSKSSIFGDYYALDQEKMESATAEEKAMVGEFQIVAQKDALKSVAILPIIMFVSYAALFFYFRSKGGYKSIDIGH